MGFHQPQTGWTVRAIDRDVHGLMTAMAGTDAQRAARRAGDAAHTAMLAKRKEAFQRIQARAGRLALVSASDITAEVERMDTEEVEAVLAERVLESQP